MITFAIPYYSGAEYLRRAIESVLAQDVPTWRAVVCDDGSDPATEQLVLAAGQGRVRYVKNPQNLGMARNWNQCLDVADTDLVTILHGDDELVPTYARLMGAAAERHPKAAALFCRYDVIGPSSVVEFSLTDFIKDLINPARGGEAIVAGEPGMRALLRANFITATTLCYRKSVLGMRRFREGYKFVLDWELTTSLLLDGDTIVGIPDRCMRYRRHDASATEQLTREQKRFDEESRFYDRMAGLVAERGWASCVPVARRKSLTRLHIAYRAAKSCARLDLAEARRGLELLRTL